MTKAQQAQRIKELEAKIEFLMPQKSEVTNTNYRFAFKIGEVDYYKWNTVEDIPLNRKIYIDGFIKSTNLVMSLEDQREVFSKTVQITLDPRYDDKKKLESIRNLSIQVMNRIQMVSLPKMIYRLMSMLYLTKQDDLSQDLPSEEIEKRAVIFETEKKKTLEEIFSQPMSSLLMMNLSTEKDTKLSSKEREAIIKNLLAQEFIANYTQKLIRDL